MKRSKTRKKLHYWTTTEKRAIYDLMTNLNLTAKTIRLKLFKGDNTITAQSLGALMNTLRKTPSWKDVEPSYPGNRTPVAMTVTERNKAKKSANKRPYTYKKVVSSSATAKRYKTYHRWTDEQNEIIQQNLTMKPSEIKRRFFANEKTITVYKISKKLTNTKGKNTKRKYNTSPRNKNTNTSLAVRRTSLSPSPANPNFTAPVEELVQQYTVKTNKLKSDVNIIASFINDTDFDTDVKNEMKESLIEIANKSFKREQNALADSLKA